MGWGWVVKAELGGTGGLSSSGGVPRSWEVGWVDCWDLERQFGGYIKGTDISWQERRVFVGYWLAASLDSLGTPSLPVCLCKTFTSEYQLLNLERPRVHTMSSYSGWGGV